MHNYTSCNKCFILKGFGSISLLCIKTHEPVKVKRPVGYKRFVLILSPYIGCCVTYPYVPSLPRRCLRTYPETVAGRAAMLIELKLWWTRFSAASRLTCDGELPVTGGEGSRSRAARFHLLMTPSPSEAEGRITYILFCWNSILLNDWFTLSLSLSPGSTADPEHIIKLCAAFMSQKESIDFLSYLYPQRIVKVQVHGRGHTWSRT